MGAWRILAGPLQPAADSGRTSADYPTGWFDTFRATPKQKGEITVVVNLLTVVIALLGVLVIASIKILFEYERGVVFFLGRFQTVKGPGLIIIIPIIQQMRRVDLRTIVMDVPPQDVISRDNVSVKVNAVIYFRVVNPERAIIQVEDYYAATNQLAQTTLRSVLGQHELDEMLAAREKLNTHIENILDTQTDAWGIKVANVEIKQVDLDERMIRAIARQAEAERERRAKIINAEGEFQAADRLLQAATIIARQPQALQLRYLQTLVEIAVENNSTVVFPLPLELLKPFLALVPKPGDTARSAQVADETKP